MSNPANAEQPNISVIPDGHPLCGETMLAASNVPALMDKGGLGRRVSRSTVFRWLTHGTQGVHLEGIRVGGTWYTSVEAVRRFIAATTEAATTTSTDSPTVARPSSCPPTHHAAVRKLRQRGMKV